MRKRIREEAKIIYNKKVHPGYFLMRLAAPKIAARAKPGQFVNIRIDKEEVFFRRPFDFRKINVSTIEILYKVIGSGTRWLSLKEQGGLDLIGPLGSGFHIPSGAKPKTHVLLSGGIGIAPLMDVAEHLKKSRERKIAFLGAREKKLIFCKKELAACGFKVITVIDHIKGGKPVFMLDVFEEFLAKEEARNIAGDIVAYSVGPQPMIAQTARLARRYDIPVQISYEVDMGCGYGVCRGCNIMTKEGYKMVCQDGPVFDARMIDDERF